MSVTKVILQEELRDLENESYRMSGILKNKNLPQRVTEAEFSETFAEIEVKLVLFRTYRATILATDLAFLHVLNRINRTYKLNINVTKCVLNSLEPVPWG